MSPAAEEDAVPTWIVPVFPTPGGGPPRLSKAKFPARLSRAPLLLSGTPHLVRGPESEIGPAPADFRSVPALLNADVPDESNDPSPVTSNSAPARLLNVELASWNRPV